MIGESAHQGATAVTERSFPPITELTAASMVLVILGGIYLAAYIPRAVPLGPAVSLLVTSGAVLVADLIVLSRLRDFAWDTFFQVARWALLAYIVIAGMLEYVFVVDHTRGSVLVVLTLMLVIYAVDIPVLLAFSVARYQEPARPGEK
ncbi:MAG TPA: hypothetical protein VF221_16105 [Chloroflexota bacterium]